MKILWSVFILGIICVGKGQGIPGRKYEKLTRHNVEPHITISGISGGGSLAMILAFVYSSFIRGAGIMAGGPYPVGVILLENPGNIFNFKRHVEWTNYFAERGYIDDPKKYMPGFRAYIYHGSSDPIVPKQLSEINRNLFSHYGATVKDHIGAAPSGHCVPTADRNDHRVCSAGLYFAICACGYSAVNHMFSHFYPHSFRDSNVTIGTKVSGKLFKYDQNEFFPTSNFSLNGFYEFGYAYIPQRCRPETGVVCKLHFAFHGCGQNIVALLLKRVPEFITETGYLETADANDVIMIFPQGFPDFATKSLNYIGCFDLYSYTSPFTYKFSTKWGIQPLAVKKMFERILMGDVGNVYIP